MYAEAFEKTARRKYERGERVHPEKTLYEHLAGYEGLEIRVFQVDYALGRVVNGTLVVADPYKKLKDDFPEAF